MKSKFLTFLIMITSWSCIHMSHNKTQTELWINNPTEFNDWQKRRLQLDWNDLVRVHEITAGYLKDYPKSLHARYIAAVMAGDYSELLSTDEERRIKAKASADLFSLLENSADIPAYFVGVLRNEYYYHSNQFLQQYLLGCEHLKGDTRASGYFSIGVGASEHAWILLQGNDIEGAQYFAKKAVEGWEMHAAAQPEWKYPYPYFYIQALAIAGLTKQARQRLEDIKKEPQYALKKPIYDKYEMRLTEVQKILGTRHQKN